YIEEKAMSFLKKFVNFLRESKTELSKVSWSTRREVIGASAVVIVITIVMAFFIGAVDLVLTRFLAVVMK
ncbi:MAG: preprotein translocase subunit SecE, partial [Candidatus Omnitrophica bacterium]|nr:preprotein translocase subunit SecE [Candidatus Omnitrophota bacterium]